MRFKPSTWKPVAVGLSALNLAGFGFAAGAQEPLHAAVHLVAAAAFGFWATRLRPRSGRTAALSPADAADREARLEALEIELDDQRRELAEAQERLDFAERLLAQAAERRQVAAEPRQGGTEPQNP